VVALGIVSAVGASVLYNASIALQALEVRREPGEHSLRVSLIGRLVRNRRWLGATALGLAGWPLEIVALLLAPLTVVQPCLASGLILLLWLGAVRLGERPGRREWIAVAAIIAGVAGVALAAPERTTDHAGTGPIALALVLVAIPILAPYALRGRIRHSPHQEGVKVGWANTIALLAVLSAGCGYAWTAIASKLLTDELAAGALLVAVAWLATAAASEGIALLSEMSALQRRPATHVAPAMLAVQIIVPVLLAPLIFGESWGDTPLGGVALVASMTIAVAGTILLAGSGTVGAAIEAAHAGHEVPSDAYGIDRTGAR
jgi:drug/metabolite transporter (DMT)-like permease